MRKVFSYIVITAILISLLISIFNVKFWKQDGQVIKWDVLEYYGYLPSALIYKDLSLKYTERSGEDWGKRIWALTAPNGNKVFKMTMGMSFMYAPFFGLAHGYANTFGYKADGFSSPYKFTLLMSCLFYLVLGLLFLRKTLLLFFNDIITGFTLLAVVAGTNLWYYASFEAPMSHAYSFSLISIFVWVVVRFYKTQSFGLAVFLGVLVGLISLIRPSNAILGLFFLLYGISKTSHFKERLHFLISTYKYLIVAALCALLVWVPQIIYWYCQTGHLLYFSYAENGAFYFDNPQLIKGLFGFRKGWFLYTPLMLLAIISIPLTWKYSRSFSITLLIFIPVNICIILSWWCWWYGGCFGQRAFIDSYALMALPLAAFLQWSASCSVGKRVVLYFIFFFCIGMNIKHTMQYYYGSIHWDSMTKEAYLDSFWRLRPDPDFYKLIRAPDYEKALKGEEY